MNTPLRVPLMEVAPPTPSSWSPSPTEDVWLLNLDQVEPMSGAVLSRRKIKAGDVPTSTVAFDDTHVLYSKLRPNLNKVVLPSAAGYCTSELLPLKPDPRRLDRVYLAHYLRSTAFVAWAVSRTDGAKMPRVKMDALREHCIPVLELTTQRRIAAILDNADAIRRNRIRVVSTVDEYLHSAFFELFGDPVGNSKGLPEKPIADIATVTTGNTPSREIVAYYGDHIEWIKSDNINTPSHFLTKATEGLSEAGLRVARTAPAGSTLITCIAGSPSCIGNAALADRAISFNQQINALTPKPGIEPEFIYAVTLFSKARIRAASTNGMKGMVSKGALERVRFILPPKDQREKFVGIFRKAMALTKRLEYASRQAEELYGSLSQRAFQGQL
ncbi:restriction endonuclease subunit S [Cupriavidus sp. SW-Y-13]|uniref:restriction endonuclease subunit S n=1 Tax=Cupriavidus sp. SW-Y-13 TaxID=2653854 RepID=UPI001365E1F6|nr:restriction endonuclease subunit S [Cupriavidus sp. SW-Y-13]MWL88129.1 restriction endonuclease subunit S [Cupriavidus sp. SW-Y-13]